MVAGVGDHRIQAYQVPWLRQWRGATPSTATLLQPTPAADRVTQAPTCRMQHPHRSAAISLRAIAAPLRSQRQCRRSWQSSRSACLRSLLSNVAVQPYCDAAQHHTRRTAPLPTGHSTAVIRHASCARHLLGHPGRQAACLAGGAVSQRCRASTATSPCHKNISVVTEFIN